MLPQQTQAPQSSSNDVKIGEDFASSKWRPFMGWTYMFICLFDFCIGPVMNVVFSIMTKTPLIAWKSLTLDNGGLFHLAMGAVLGVAAYGRTQEKVAKIESGPTSPTPSMPFGGPPNSPPMTPMGGSSYNQPPMTSYQPSQPPMAPMGMSQTETVTETTSVTMTPTGGDAPTRMRGRFR